MLQIVKYGEPLDHGSDQALYSATNGHKISPASTENFKKLVDTKRVDFRNESFQLYVSYMG